MRLEFENGSPLEEPTVDEIAGALADLGGTRGAFAILSRAGGDFMQAAAGRARDYTLEYREGERLFQAERPLPLDKVTRAFQAYARGDDAWRGHHRWKPLEESRKGSGCLGMVAVAAVSLGSILLLAI